MVALRISGYFKNTLIFAAMITGLMSSAAYSLDNPDVPDYIAQFTVRAQVYEQAGDESKLTHRGMLIAYNNYQLFLDEELNAAYQLLRSKLSRAQQDTLKKSQQQWFEFRDAEFEFINNNWTRASFGSSFVLSRGGYRTSIIKNRVIQLLHYVKNY